MSSRYPEGSRAVIYTRISRDASGERAGVTRQSEDCHRLVDYRRWKVVEELSDNSLSAYSTTHRPAWERVLELVAAGEVDVVVAYHMDRLTRNMRDLERLIVLAEESGVGVITVEGDVDLTTDMGRMIARILAAVARQEVERKGARQRRANLDRASKGEPWKSGWVGFGYDRDKNAIPEQAEMIRQAATDVLNGKALKRIAREWADSGVSTPRSSKGADGWTHNGLKSILLNPVNAGLVTYKGEVVGRGNWEPILDEETHTLLVAYLTDPARKTLAAQGRQPANLLSGIATCATCGEPVQGGTKARTRQVNGKRETVGRVPVYRCKSDHVATPRGEADALAVTAFQTFVQVDGRAHEVFALPRGEDQDALVDEIERLREQLSKLGASFAEDRITIEQLETASESLRAKVADAQARLDGAGAVSQTARERIAANVHRFGEMDTESQRRVFAEVATVVLHPRGRGQRNVPMNQQMTIDVTIPPRELDQAAYPFRFGRTEVDDRGQIVSVSPEENPDPRETLVRVYP